MSHQDLGLSRSKEEGLSIVEYEAGDGFSFRVEVSQRDRATWHVSSLTIYDSNASQVALITGGKDPFGVAFSSREEALRAAQRRGKQEGDRIAR